MLPGTPKIEPARILGVSRPMTAKLTIMPKRSEAFQQGRWCKATRNTKNTTHKTRGSQSTNDCKADQNGLELKIADIIGCLRKLSTISATLQFHKEVQEIAKTSVAR